MLASEAFRVIKATLGKPEPLPDECLIILNDAGEWFCQAHDWRFMWRRTRLTARAQITLADATWAPSTLTLTLTGAFADYSFLAGDEVVIEDGTGVTEGVYPIASRTSDDAIVLGESISSGAPTDVDGTMHLTGMALPSDFLAVLPDFPIRSVSLQADMELTDIQEVVLSNTVGGGIGFAPYLGALAYAAPSGSGVVVPRIEYAPEITAGEHSAFEMHYRGKWRRLATDTTATDIPAHAEAAFRECLHHFARGSVMEDDGTLDQRLAGYVQGSTWNALIEADASQQPSLGRMVGGAVGNYLYARPRQAWTITDPT